MATGAETAPAAPMTPKAAVFRKLRRLVANFSSDIAILHDVLRQSGFCIPLFGALLDEES